MKRNRFGSFGLVVAFLCCMPVSRAMGAETGPEASTAAEADEGIPEPNRPQWNGYDGKYFTSRLGAGLLIDTANYSQDVNSKSQMELNSALKLRDFRLLLKGKFKFSPNVSYSIGYMYDATAENWRFRQTGIKIDIPELGGNVFIGRTKEGFSTSKIMVGYNGWTNERSAANDSFLPILADGVKWTGGLFGGSLVYNIGWFTNALTLTEQTYVKNDNQFVARTVWLPYAKSESQTILHLALEGRAASALNGQLQYRSRPESFSAQSYAVDTGKFPAAGSNTLGLEAYYRPGSFMLGSEYYFNQAISSETKDPLFQGGEIFASYLVTGEVRPYNETGGYFEAVSPKRSVFDGGIGAWELVLRYSYVDLNAGLIQGGRFQRITPMVNWYLADQLRLEVVYGYGDLDRFGVRGDTQFFQTRVQLQLL